jgi:hypothetical protein
VVAEQAGGEAEKGFVGLLAAVGADQEAAFCVQVADRALDDVALGAEAGAVLGLASRDRVADAARSQEAAVLVVVIATIGEHALGPLSWPATARAAYRGDLVHERDQLRDVVAVGAGHAPGQRQAAGVRQEVVLGARPGAVDRARPEPAAPLFACT